MNLKYVKKPIPVEAIQITEEFGIHSVYYWEDFLPDWYIDAVKAGKVSISNSGFGVHTLEGTMLAPFNSYLVRGVDGELYPCREDIFKKSYDEYKEENNGTT